MIYTISAEVVESMLNKELEEFSKEPDNMQMIVKFGKIAGLYELYSKLDGVPQEKYVEYQQRILGICELKSMLQFP